MKRVRTPGLGVALLGAATFLCAAESPQKVYDDLPGAGKPVRGGYIITTEGGVDGTQSTYYAPGANRKGPGVKLDPNDRRGMGPVSTADKPGVVNNGGRLTNGDKPVDIGDGDVDAVVGRLASREENLSEKRFDRTGSDKFTKDSRFDSGERPDYGRWGREGERRDRETSERFGSGDKYDTSARPEFGRWAREDDRRDRERFAGSGDRADVKNWGELFSRDKNARYTDRDISSPLGDKVNDTVARMQAYDQVSMQQINRTAFRRSHSDEAGATPVAPIGKGDAGVKTTAPHTPPPAARNPAATQ